MKCHDPHASGAYPVVLPGIRLPFVSLPRLRGRLAPDSDPGPGREGFSQPGRAVSPKLCLSASRTPFLHPVLFQFVPSSRRWRGPCGEALIRAYPARAPAPAGARIAAARFARLIAPARPCARPERRAHVSRRLPGVFFAPARTGRGSGSADAVPFHRPYMSARDDNVKSIKRIITNKVNKHRFQSWSAPYCRARGKGMAQRPTCGIVPAGRDAYSPAPVLPDWSESLWNSSFATMPMRGPATPW